MRNTWVIARRELGSYYASPLGYVLAALFLLVAGYLFALPFYFGSRDASLRNWMQTVVVLLLFVAPMLTMRLLAEEKQSGTIELVLTSPLRDWELVLGKFVAALIFWLSILAVTAVFPVILRIFGDPDVPPLLSGYLALILLGAAMLAVGVLSSALSPNQIVAVVTGFVLLLLLWLAGSLQNVFSGQVGGIFAYLSLTAHMDDLMKGVVDSKDIIYYLSVVVGCLFLSTQVVAARRWS